MKQTPPPMKTFSLSPYSTPSPKTKSPNYDIEEQKPLSSQLSVPDVYTVYSPSIRPEFQFQNFGDKGYKMIIEPEFYYSSNMENEEFYTKFESHSLFENWKSYTTRKTKEEKEQQYENAKRSIKCNKPQSSFPDKGTVNNIYKEKWLEDLSNNKKTLRELGNDLPHGFTAENLVDILYKKQVPILNASWLIKLACLSQFTKKKVVDLLSKWTEIFLNYLNETLKEKDMKKIKYLMNLEKHCIEEGLLDQEEIENWIIKQFEEGIQFLKEEQNWFIENHFMKQEDYSILSIQKFIKHPLIYENILLLKNSTKLLYFFKYLLNKRKIIEMKRLKWINLPRNLIIEELDSFLNHGDYNKIMNFILEYNRDILYLILDWNIIRNNHFSYLISFEIINRLLINQEIKNEFQIHLQDYLNEKLNESIIENESFISLLKEIIKYQIFNYDIYIKSNFEKEIHKKLIEKVPVLTINLLNTRRNYLYGPKMKWNEEEMIHQTQKEIENYLQYSIEWNLEKNIFYEKIALNLIDFKMYNYEKVIELIERYKDYSLLCEILIHYLNKNEFQLKMISYLYQYKEYIICNYKMNEMIRILIKKSENSTKDYQRIIQEYISRIQYYYPSIIHLDLFKKEVHSIFIFDGMDSLSNYKSISIKDLSNDLLKYLDLNQNYQIIIQKLKSLKLKNIEIQMIIKYCIQKAFENENYLTFLLEFYLNGQFLSNEFCEILLFILRNDTNISLDSCFNLIQSCIQMGIITSENTLEIIIKGLIQSSSLSHSFIFNLFYSLLKNLKFSFLLIPKMMFWIYDFIQNDQDFIPKIYILLFKKLEFKSSLILKILDEDKDKKLIHLLFQSFHLSKLLNLNFNETLNEILKEMNEWNAWLYSLFFNIKFNHSSDEIFNYFNSNSIQNLSIFYQLIIPQKEVREKLIQKLSSIQNVYKIEIIIIYLLKYDHFEDLIDFVINELNLLLKNSKSISIITLSNHENYKNILIYLTLFYYLIQKVKISNYLDIILSFFDSKFSILDDYNILLFNILSFSFSKLDENSKIKIRKFLLDLKKIPQKFGWNIIEDYISHCNSCNSIHGNLPPNLDHQRSKIVKKTLKRKI